MKNSLTVSSFLYINLSVCLLTSL